VRFTRCDEHAYGAFFGALRAAFDHGDQTGKYYETYFDHETDRVDGNGSEIINALIAYGWKPPEEQS
jgi:hypothetical protein